MAVYGEGQLDRLLKTLDELPDPTRRQRLRFYLEDLAARFWGRW